MLMHWLFGGGGGYTGCLSPVYLDSQSVGSEWYINHWCPKTVQVDMTVEHKQTLQQGHPIRNGICQSVHTGQQFLMLSVYCLSIFSIMSNIEIDTNTAKNYYFMAFTVLSFVIFAICSSVIIWSCLLQFLGLRLHLVCHFHCLLHQLNVYYQIFVMSICSQHYHGQFRQK